MSIQPTKLIITALALAVICLAGRIMDLGKTVVVTPRTGAMTSPPRTKIDGTPPPRRDRLTELDVYMTNPGQLKKYVETFTGTDEGAGVFNTLWHFSADRFQGAVVSVFDFKLTGVKDNIADFFRSLGWALRYHTVYCIVFFVIVLCVMSIGGGAICRIAALQFSRGEKPGLTEAIRYSTRRFISFFTTPLAPLGIIAFIGAFILLLGLMGNIPFVGELIVGLGAPLALFAGALIAVIVIGAVVGFGMMFPAVAYDGSDCFDAISRSFSYVFAKPWHMLFYTSIAAVYGSICYTIVRFFAYLSLWITRFSVQIALWTNDSVGKANKLAAIWPKPEFNDLLGAVGPLPTNQTESVAAFLVYLFLLVVVGLVVSFVISFYFSANTIIYSLMRGKVDNTPREDIYMPFQEADVEHGGTESESRDEQTSPKAEPQPDSSSPGQ
ncbi:MAG: hypothetical protein A2Z25_23815 [Planctomycetes bacterium RBG_16_55_9]|nr:MAG: hypothetical protein A2Z25_23815 [Planctomycetes bacterium RBG_16_55_9]